jgi:pimeloyl-ACP methyl ester carboxylesterase
LGGSAKTWDHVLNALPERDTVAITQRGWGESAHLGGPYGLQQFADDVEAILDQLDLSQVVLVGHSMGGKVAQIVAGRGTPALTGLILVAPAPPVPPPHITSQYREQISHAYDNAESIRYARDHVLTYRQLPEDLAAQVLADSAASRTTPPGCTGRCRASPRTSPPTLTVSPCPRWSSPENMTKSSRPAYSSRTCFPTSPARRW